MKIKPLTKILGALVPLSIVFGLTISNWDEITRNYNKAVWEPNATSLGGISIGDTRSNVIFNKGAGELNDPDAIGEQDEHMLLYRTIYPEKAAYYNETLAIIFDEEDFVAAIIRYGNRLKPPFTNVEPMKQLLGEEDILSISKDYESRRYTYLDWGVSYSFEKNLLRQVMIGEVEWRQESLPGEYIVKGRKVCPSDDCPWGEEGELKPEYEEKDYRIFLSQ